MVKFHIYLSCVPSHRHINIRSLNAAVRYLNVVTRNWHITDAIVRCDLGNSRNKSKEMSNMRTQVTNKGMVLGNFYAIINIILLGDLKHGQS